MGLLAAYAGGWVDSLIMRLMDLQLSFPSILIALVLLAVLGQGVDKIVIALIAVQWAYYARAGRRRRAWSKRKEDTWTRRASRRTARRIVFRHILPNRGASDRRRYGAVAARSRWRPGSLVPRARHADHLSLTRLADRQRLRPPYLGQVLDQFFIPAWHCSSPSSRSTWSATSCATCSTRAWQAAPAPEAVMV